MILPLASIVAQTTTRARLDLEAYLDKQVQAVLLDVKNQIAKSIEHRAEHCFSSLHESFEVKTGMQDSGTIVVLDLISRVEKQISLDLQAAGYKSITIEHVPPAGLDRPYYLIHVRCQW